MTGNTSRARKEPNRLEIRGAHVAESVAISAMSRRLGGIRIS